MDLLNKQISKEKAKELHNHISLNGWPSPNRVLICTPTGETQTASGIIIPGGNEKDLPRKGVIVHFNIPDNEDKSGYDLSIGDVVTYGMYAGKELDIDIPADIINREQYKFTVLSLTEIIYIEV